MFKKKKKEKNTWLKADFDSRLLNEINQARVNYHQAQESETALVDARVNGQMIQAQTALEKAKFSYLYNEARRRRTVAKQPLLYQQARE